MTPPTGPMVRFLPLATWALLAFVPAAVMAAPGLYLSGNDCQLSPASAAVTASVRYYAIRLVFLNDAANGCSGCDVAACVLLNSIHFGRIREEADPLRLDSAGSAGSNHVTWQGAGGDCAVVPAQRVSWGQ